MKKLLLIAACLLLPISAYASDPITMTSKKAAQLCEDLMGNLYPSKDNNILACVIPTPRNAKFSSVVLPFKNNKDGTFTSQPNAGMAMDKKTQKYVDIKGEEAQKIITGN